MRYSVSKSYAQYQEELKAEQADKSREQIVADLESAKRVREDKLDASGQPIVEKRYDHVFDPDNAPKVKHRWVDRGLKLSCEGANHSNHQVFKRQLN